MMSLAWGESASMYEGGDVLDRLRRIVREIDVDVRTSARVTAIKHVEIAEGQPAWLVRHESADGSGSSIEVFDRVIMTTLDLDVKLETTSDGQTITLDLETSYNSRNPAAPAAARGESSAAPVYVSFFTTRDATVSAWLHVEDQVLFLEPENAADLRELAPVREIVVGHTDAIANNPRVEYLYRVLSSRPILEDLQKLDKITWTYQTKIEKVFPPTSQSWSPVASPFPPFTLPWAPGLWWTTTMSHAETTPTNVDQSWWAGRLAAYDLIEELSGGDEDE
ncbi:hypothetical protein F5Y14DRAFT_359722 [Nemania sp. NC0429]|nr:hypothetical protein F5Y14DRAFT_359722 [Nemania sp. NC0429]